MQTKKYFANIFTNIFEIIDIVGVMHNWKLISKVETLEFDNAVTQIALDSYLICLPH